jgi:ParB family transcriptional regulator, chromosome partitioning protein
MSIETKRDHLRSLAGNIAESMGVGVAPGNTAVEPHLSASPLPGAKGRMDGLTRSRNVAEIPVDKIGPDPDQPRTEFDDAAIARLAESLKAAGQLQPIRVRWDDARGLYMVIVGERRWRAAQLAGLPTLTAVIHDGTPAAGELLSWQLVENAQREDLAPVEQARAYRRLMDLNRWSGAQLARELAVDPASVTRALSLLDLPGPVREMVEDAKLSPRTAYEVAKLSSPDDQLAMADRIVSEGMTRDEAAAAVRERPTRGERPARWRRVRVDLGAAGNVVVTVPAFAKPGAAAALLRQAIRKLATPEADDQAA